MENFKIITGCPAYKISNLGNIRSNAKGTEKAMCPAKSSKGYLQISLSNNGCRKTFKVHRLVAFSFIDNPENHNEVNHINGKKQDNRVENLEWCSHKENMIHATREGLNSIQKAVDSIKRKVYDRKTNQVYESTAQAARELGMKRSTLKNMLTGHRRNKTSIAYY